MIVRPYYLDILKTYRDVPLVKILAGIRRCGKSTILDMLKDDLLGSGIAADHVIHLRYTSEELDDSMTAKQMYRDIKEKMTDSERYYLLLDEVQEVDGWEKAVNSLLEDSNTDIYVTGSNSKLMSSEISTYLTGRYISIPVFTLSFAEYLEFKKDSGRTPKELLNEYIRMGGFPIVALGNFDERSSYQIVEGIYNSVITSDITKRHNITNFDLFNRVVRKRCKPERNSGVVGSQRHFDHLKHLHAPEFHLEGCVSQCDFRRISLRLMRDVPPMSLRKSACKRQIC